MIAHSPAKATERGEIPPKIESIPSISSDILWAELRAAMLNICRAKPKKKKRIIRTDIGIVLSWK